MLWWKLLRLTWIRIQGRESTVPFLGRGWLHPVQRSAYPAQPTVPPFPHSLLQEGRGMVLLLQGGHTKPHYRGQAGGPPTHRASTTGPHHHRRRRARLLSFPPSPPLRGWKRRGGRRDHSIPLPRVGVRGPWPWLNLNLNLDLNLNKELQLNLKPKI